jgi:hypothetical protein
MIIHGRMADKNVSHFLLPIYFGLEWLTKIMKWLTFLSAIFEWMIITWGAE